MRKIILILFVIVGGIVNAQTWTDYPRFTEYDSIMQNFVADHPTLCTLDTIGLSVDGRELFVIKISDNPGTEEDEPEVFYTSTMHGNETGGFVLMLNLIDYLLDNYGVNGRITNLIDSLEIWINPLYNPDGAYTSGNEITSPTRFNSNGYDLNRNYPFPPGYSPARQAETSAMINFLTQRRFVLSVSFHAGAELFDYPWTGWDKTHADSAWFFNIGKEYVNTVWNYCPDTYMDDPDGTGITQGYDWYTYNGGMDDYVTYNLNGRQVAIELDIHWVTNINPTLTQMWNYNYRSLITYLENALNGIHGYVKDNITDSAVPAKLFIVSHDIDNSHVYSDTLTGRFVRFITPGTWDLTFSASGYRDTTIVVIVTDYNERIDLYVKMEPGTSPPATPPVYISSSIENSSPSRLEIIYNLTLANIVPDVSAFTLKVNSVVRNVSSVAISGSKVLLTLSNPVVYGDDVTISYTKPSANPLQTPTGGQAASIDDQEVTNNVSIINTPPEIVVNYQPNSNSGFVYDLDASGSFDVNKDNLTFTWGIPSNIPVSSTSGSSIKYLSPVFSSSQTVEFTLSISDGKITKSEVLPITILPYKPELEISEILNIEASSFQTPDFPQNILDNNIETNWSAYGDNQWIIISLRRPFKISHVMLAFPDGLIGESFFDIAASKDSLSWDPVLTGSVSCAFSGKHQVFDFPSSATENYYSFLKLTGHCNSTNDWNYISEFMIFGTSQEVDLDEKKSSEIVIFPNPAKDILNIRINDPVLKLSFIRICNFAGQITYEDKIEPDMKEFNIPLNLRNGIYIIQMGFGNLTLFTQKLVISK